ncbi:MAG TPA: sugar ABC transporter substrate-binding protein [Allosphingosinicella sp.]|jgi:multiple sugar transport system substrate-binding protein
MRNYRTVLVLLVLVVVGIGAYSVWHSRQPTTIRLIGEAYAPLDALNKIKGEFERSTGFKVEIVQKDHEAVVAEVDQELSSGQVTYDIILEPHRLLGKRVEKGQVQPLDRFLTDPSLHNASFDPASQLFPRWWREIGWYKGRLYGYPFTSLTMYVSYRKDMMENPAEKAAFRQQFGRELAPPRSWQEYMDLAKFFNHPERGMNGTYIQGQQHVALWYEWLNFAYSFGGNILDAKKGSDYGDIVVNSPQNVQATKQYLSLIQYSPRETLNYNWDDALASLQQGRVFMGILWHDQTPLLEDPSVSKVAGKMGYALIPSATGTPFSQLEGWTYLIPTKSPHPKEAYRFIEWAMSRNVQIQQTLHGGASALQSTYQDPRVRRIPYVPTFLQSIPIGVPKPTIPESSQITEIMQRGLSQIVTRRTSPEHGLDAIAIQIGQVLRGKAKLRYPPKA